MAKERKVVKTEWQGRELSLSTGKLSNQANACVLAQYGETVIMATVTQSAEEQSVDFFPLMVDFEEKLYAAGIIKGSRWIKREGQPSEKSILTGRMVDRAIRPLFDESSRRGVQVILTVLSVDKENDHDIVSLIAASAALSVSGIDWQGPIAGTRVGLIDNELVYNPTYKQQEESPLNLIIAGDTKKVIMIECQANELSEQQINQAIEQGKKTIKPALDLIYELKKNINIPSIQEQQKLESQEEKEAKEKELQYKEMAESWLKENVKGIIFKNPLKEKQSRQDAIQKIKNQLDKHLFDNQADSQTRQKIIKLLVKSKVEEVVGQEILDNKKRLDERGLDEIRELVVEIGILPRNHGAGLFSRGETQILSIITLGAPGLEQATEGIEGSDTKRFMHHYNFPPFSVGEVKPMRAPTRREVGHGSLAEKALSPVIPSKQDFPYTIRVVSETLSSNGSSSMGATCASSLALMDAGAPIKKAVAGIAMGLVSNSDMSQWTVLTDMQDLEDSDGGMDFKIAGTRDGITAIQLDTKTAGLPKEVVDTTLKQGHTARMKVLDVMEETIKEPHSDLSPYAPLIKNFYVNIERIHDIIGPGGKTINKITKEKDVSIDIEEDGLVMICGQDQEKVKEATDWVEDLTKEFKVGEMVKGEVVRLTDFGAFIQLTSNKDGMVHVSEMAPYHISKPSDFLSIGDKVTVKVKEIDDYNRINLTMKNLEDNQHLWKDRLGESQNNQNRKQFNKNSNQPPKRR